MNNIKKQIGARLRKLRLENGYTQEKISEMLGISQKHYSEVERGLVGLGLGHLVQISELFSVSLDYLIKGVEPINYSFSGITVFNELYASCSPYTQKQILSLLQIVYDIEKHSRQQGL